MSLEIKRISIDSRFRAAGSKSATDFKVELPRSLDVPDDVVAYIDDFVLPVSWSTTDQRNQNLYYELLSNTMASYHTVAMPPGNYIGSTFAHILQAKLKENHGVETLTWSVSYNITGN
jgi:hypothetical protein